MRAEDFWDLFLDTGAPEIYMLYIASRNQREDHVSNDSGNRSPGNGLQ